MSEVKISPQFTDTIEKLRIGITVAGDGALKAVMAQAEADARAKHRWRQKGQYTETSGGGSEWSWEVTGTTEESITGYVVSPLSAKRLNAVGGASSTVTLRYGNKEVVFEKNHTTDAELTGTYEAPPGHILGVLTMYSAYANYLQQKEAEGTTLPGGMGPGEYITVEVLEQNWDSVYAQGIAAPEIARILEMILG